MERVRRGLGGVLFGEGDGGSGNEGLRMYISCHVFSFETIDEHVIQLLDFQTRLR